MGIFLLRYISCLCCITNYYEVSSLKLYTFIISVSADQEFGYDLAVSSAQGLTRLQSKCHLGCVFIRSLDWGRIHFHLIQVVGRIHFLPAL